MYGVQVGDAITLSPTIRLQSLLSSALPAPSLHHVVLALFRHRWRFTDVFHRVALTLDRVPSVGWCNRFEYGLLLLLTGLCGLMLPLASAYINF